MIDPAQWSRPMDRWNLNIFLTASVYEWRFKSTKLVILPIVVAYIQILAKPWITFCWSTIRTCWTSRERVKCRRQDPSNFVAVLTPRPLKLRRSDPQLSRVRCPLHGCTCCPWAGGPRRGGPRRPHDNDPRRRTRWRTGGKKSYCAWWTLGCAYSVVCRNRTAIQLQIRFHLWPAFYRAGKSCDSDMQGTWQDTAVLLNSVIYCGTIKFNHDFLMKDH